MTAVIAKKRIHRTKAGGTLNLSDAQARALVALGIAEYPPKPVSKVLPPVPKTIVQQSAPSTYMRRDLTAEQPHTATPVGAMTTKPSNG